MTPEQEKLVTDNMGLVYHIAKVLNAAQDEDLIQDGMVALCKAANTYCAGRGVKYSTYAYRCVRNEMLTSIRRTSEETHLSLDEKRIKSEGAGEPENYIDRWEAQGEFNKLNERTRKIVKLKIEGYTQKEITKLLGLTASAVSNVLRKIKKKQGGKR